MASFRQVIALTRGLAVLRLVNEERRATVGSLHAKTGLDKATIVRMLETLEAEGYISRDPEGPTYFPTGKVNLLSSGYVAHQEAGRMVAPVLAASRETLRWPAIFAIFDRDAMIVADTTPDMRTLTVTRDPIHRPPILPTSVGRAYFGFMPPSERAHLLDLLGRNPLGWNALAAEREKAEALAREVKERGYALADPAYLTANFNGEIWAVAVPVMDGGKLFGSLGLLVLSRVLSPEKGVAEIVPGLKEVAPRIARALGG